MANLNPFLSVSKRKNSIWRSCIQKGIFIMLFFCVISLSFSQIPTTGLVAYYPFNGNLNDASGNAFNGTSEGTTTFALDRFGSLSSALATDGASSGINVGNPMDIDKSFTFSGWYQTTDTQTDNWQTIFMKSDYYPGFGLMISNLGHYLRIYNNGYNGIADFPFTPVLNRWYHIGMTYNGSLISLFVDGILLGSTSFTTSVADQTTLYLGKNKTTGTNLYSFKGKFDDIRIYNRALSVVEIQTLYHENNWGVSSNCVTKFTDSFTGTLSNWTNPTGQGSWTISSGKLVGSYDIGCGSTTCPQADLILNDQYQITDNWKATASFNKYFAYSYGGDAYGAAASFSLWVNSSSKVVVYVGEGGISLGGLKDSLIVQTSRWNGSWSSLPLIPGSSKTGRFKYPLGSWNTDGLNTASIQKKGSVYTVFFNDVYITEFQETFLTGQVKIGFHSYGNTEIESFQLDSCSFNSPNQGLVAYYPLNGDKIDYSGNNIVLSNDGNLNYSKNRFNEENKAFYFDGSSRLYTAQSLGFGQAGDATISAWIKPERYKGSSGYPYASIVIYDKANERSIRLWTDSTALINNPVGAKILAESRPIGDYGYSSYSLTNNSHGWMHVVSVVANNTIQLWINGISYPNTVIANNGSLFNSGLAIGANNANNLTQHFKGLIDEVRIYNRALSSSEINSLYHEGGYAQMTDYDGNTYETVQIGTQTWMKENLKVTHYRNGDAIPNVTDNTAWTNLTTGAYCNYNNDVATANIYGKLYNFYSVADTRQLCPTGWHVPSSTEWTVLSDYLGGESAAGIKLKETGFTHWTTPNTGADNTSGFTALPGGVRDYGAGYFINLGIAGEWSAYPEYSTTNTWYFQVDYNTTSFWKRNYPKGEGFSVRCIKDDTSNGLIAYYPFNGNANDESGNGNNGINNGATITGDRFGNTSGAYQFSSSHITVPDALSINPTSEISISFWVNTIQSVATTPIAKRVYNGDIDYEVYFNLNQSNQLAFYYHDVSGVLHVYCSSNPIIFVDGKWHHVALKYISGISQSFKYYLDGVECSGSWITGTGNGSLANRASDLLIGKQASISSGYFDGKFDQISIYNRALSASEISALYHEGGYAQMTDYDGNTYETVQIGTQTWMKENLKVTHYRNGDAIPNVTDNTAWTNLTTGAYCNYNNDVATANIYGKLYNFYSVADTRQLCPTGWHVPSDGEWTTLETYLGGISVAGGKMKEVGTLHWTTPNTGADNISGFLALPGGTRNSSFGYINGYSYFYSSDISYIQLTYDSPNFIFNGKTNYYGMSVRCLKDDTSNGLVAYYPFNGNANDVSGNGNNGTVNGATLTTDRFGNTNSAYNFGIAKSILLPMTAPQSTNDFSFSLWSVALSNETSYNTMLGKGYNGDWNGGGLNKTGLFYGESSSNTVQIPISPLLTNYQWYHFVVIRQSNVFSLYVNGVLYGSATKSINLTNTYNWIIGTINSPVNDHYFKGNIDDIRIYNRALSVSEVNTLYQEGGWPRPTAPANLLGLPGNSQVILKWKKNLDSDFLRYRIYGGISANPTTKIDSTTNGISDTTKIISGLTNGTTYYYRVTAVNSSGKESVYSNELQIVPGSSSTLMAGLISYWGMNETSGNIVYDLCGFNHCTVNAGVTINQNGLTNRSVSFIQTSGGLTTGKTATQLGIGGGTSKSVSVWVKPSNTISYLGSHAAISLGNVADQQLFSIKIYGPWLFDSWNRGVSIGTYGDLLADGVWHHFVVTYNSVGTKLRTYLDGIFVTEDAVKTLNTGDNIPFSIGIGPQGNYIGLIDEVGLWNRALTDSEVSILYNNGSSAPYPFASPPTITTLTPSSGPIGTTVTIAGTNFSTTPANNTVWFGAVKATVTASTSTTLSVTVPVGATYQPITVSVNGLTAYSSKPFNVTFPNTGVLDATSFASKVDVTTGTGPYSPAVGDIDGDGKPDLVIPNANGNTITVYRNISTLGSISTGSFAPGVDFNTGSMPVFIAIGDIDGDGKLDLAVTNATSNTVSVFRNTSVSGTITTGSFAAKVDFATGNNPYGIAIGDLDEDGKPDMVISNFQSNTISLFRNTCSSGAITTGSFTTKVDLPTETYPFGVAIRDLDGDAKPDIAVVNHMYNYCVSVFRNISAPGALTTGSFMSRVNFTTGGIDPYDISIADIDGDSKMDMVVNNISSNSISIFRNTSTTGTINTSSFAACVDFTTGAFPQLITVGDLNGDGKPDIVSTNYNANSISVFKNTSTLGSITTSSFANKVDFATGTNPFGVAITDIDGDNKPDLLVTNVNSNTVSVYRNTISSPPPTITSFTPTSGPIGTSVTITGTNFSSTPTNNIVWFGAVKATVTAATSNSFSVTVPVGATYQPITVTVNGLTAYSSKPFNVTFPSTGVIDATSLTSKFDFSAGSVPYHSILGDIDGDGKPDVVVANYYGNTVSVFRNTSSSGSISASSFATKVDFATGVYPSNIAIVDIDGDGKLDLAVSNFTSNTVSVLRNNSSPGSITTSSFDTKVDFTSGSAPFSIVAGDIDGDGKPDLATSNQTGNSISVLRNTSTFGSITTSSFAAKVDIAIGSNPGGITINDLDGDGKPDLAVANGGSNTVSVIKNLSTLGIIELGSFAAKVDLTTGSAPFDINSGDIDGDGKLDLIVTNHSSSTVSIYRNISTIGSLTTGSFATKVDYATSGTLPRYISIGDVDGDGKPDLTIENYTNGSISIFKNTSTSGSITSSSFAGKIDFTTGTYPFDFCIGDVDGDGKPDLVVPNAGVNTLSVFRNTVSSPPPTITSFTPSSGPIGTSVTITGTNFSTTPANNTVWFGAVKATVSASTSTTLSVTVPVGATYQPITVTVNGLTAYSSKPFNVTFPSTGVLDIASFTAKLDIASGIQPLSSAISDIDSDGKLDLAILNFNSNSVSFYRNISTSGLINTGSFAAKVDLTTGTNPWGIAFGDVDGDGKPDLAITNYGSNTVSVFRNTSASGSISASSFAAPINFTTGAYPTGVIINDVDGDGKPELLVVNSTSNTLSVYRNTSVSGSITSSSFATKVDFATGNGAQYITVGDIEGDGKPDFAVSNYNGNSISVFRNVCNLGSITSGSIEAKVDFTVGANPLGVALADIDGDNKLDLIAIASNSNVLSILRNTSTSGTITTSSFATNVDFTPGTTPHDLEIGDINGDGKIDIAVTNYVSNTISVFKNISSIGSITASSLAAKVDFASGTNPFGIIIGDIDGDGKPDIATANAGSNNISVFRNTIASTAIIPTITTTAVTGVSPTTASSGGDVTADGGSTVTARGVCWSTTTNPTVALTTKTSDGTGTGIFTSTITGLLPGTTYYVRAYATNEAGTAYGSEVSFTTAGVPPSITSFTPTSGSIGTAVTITGTGFSTTPASNTVWFGAVKATVTASTSTSLSVSVPVGATYQPIIVTVNGLSGYSSKPFSVTFASSRIIDETAFASKIDFTTGTYPMGVASGDIDGDGKADLVVANFLGNAVSVYRNTSTSGAINSASFSANVDFVTGTGPRNVALGDIDGDGKLDLVVANNSGNSITVFRNTSTSGSITSGSFAAKVDFTAGTNPNGVAIGDIDGDGKPDLVVTNYSNDNVAVYRNISTTGTITLSSFASPINFATGSIPYFVTLGDLDEDTKLDMVVANSGGSTVSVFLNTSTLGSISAGSFAPKIELPTGLNPRDAAICDIDGDGKLDIIVTNYGADGISILRNISTSGTMTTGSFSAKVDFAARSNPSCTEVIDFDGDGKPDLAIANEGSNVISVLKNTSVSGSVSLATKIDFASGVGPYGIAVGDFDGDGKPDVANASYSSNSLSVYRNTIASTSVIPTVTTTSISAVTSTSAVSGGNVTAYGGSSVTYRGVCWSTLINPTISDAKTADGTGVGSYTSNITGLTAGTNYHVRAYATNTAGTAYGSDVMFTTVPLAPVAIAANPVAQNSFSANWNIATGAAGYYLDVATDNAFNYFVTGFNSKDVFNVTTFNVTGLSYNVTYYYRVRAYNASGTSTSSNTISATTVCSDVISQTPAGSTTICQGSIPTSYTTTSTNALTYVWELTPAGAGTIAGTGTTGTVTWNSTYAGSASIRVRGVNGSCNSVWTSSLAVTVNPLPSIATINGSQSVCKDQNYAEYSTAQTTGVSYNWMVDKGTIVSGQGSRTVQVTWGSSSGAGKVSLTQTISSTGCTRVDEKSVTIANSIAPAVPVISVKRKINILVCSSKNVNYQWYLDGVIVPLATKQFYWAKDKLGSYQVEVTDKTNLCKNTSKSELISSYTGSSSLMSVYPNPTKEAINIELESEELGDGRILVYDVNGNAQKTEVISKPDILFNYTLNIDGLKPGIYVVEVEVKGMKISNQKFVIL